MKSTSLFLVFVVILASFAQVSGSTIREVSLEQLYQEADVVALVRILAADAETFDHAIYKAEVIHAFKGVENADRIFFGPHPMNRLGAEYIVFLELKPSPIEQNPENNHGPWTELGKNKYHSSMYSGFSVLPVDYTCLIESCDYGVLVASSQVLLPDDLPVSRFECDPGSSDDTWVRKKDFLHLLATHGTEAQSD